MKGEKLIKKAYLKKLLSIAVPIMISNLIFQLQMVIDRMFLGHADSIYMSALGNVITPIWATMTFSLTLATGASILISQGVGSGDDSKINEYAGAIIKFNNIVPILFFFFWRYLSHYLFRLMGVSEEVMPLCVAYAKHYAPVFILTGLAGSVLVILQTSGYTKPLVVYGITRSGLNIFLDWVMIFGNLGFPAMGIEGAAIATAIAEYVGGFFILGVCLFNKKLKTRPTLAGIISSRFSSYLTSARMGINTALEDMTWNLGNMVLISFLNSIDEMAAGIYSIIFGIEILAVVIISALGTSTMTLSGDSKGEGDITRFKGTCACAYLCCIAVALVMLAASLLFPEQILGVFTGDQGIIASCGIYLVVISLNLFGKSANIVIGNTIRGSGNTIWMLYTQIFGTLWVVSVAWVLVFVCNTGILGVFLAVLLDELTRSLINLAKLRRIIRDWNKETVGSDPLLPGKE